MTTSTSVSVTTLFNALQLPEVATRDDWHNAGKKLRGKAASAGVWSRESSHADLIACLSLAYSILIEGALHNGDNICRMASNELAGLAEAKDSKGLLKSRYQMKKTAFDTARDAGKNLFKEFATLQDIPSARLFESLTLHAALSDLLPKVKAPKVKAPTVAAVAAVKSVEAEGTEAPAITVPEFPTLNNEAADAAYAATLAADAKDAAKAKAEKMRADIIAAHDAAVVAAREKFEHDAKAQAIELCRLCDFFGIKLRADQLKRLDMAEKIAA